MTASSYTKYNTFSDGESEQQHRTMSFAELPNHPLLLFYAYIYIGFMRAFLAMQFEQR